jgi:C1A family cysteine protease
MKTHLPSTVDLRDKFGPVYEQGNLGSCTANAGCGAYSFISNQPTNPSRLFLYYNERLLDNDISEDAGSSLYECTNALEQFGVCDESLWPYNINMFADQPPQVCYDQGKQHEVIEAKQVNQTLNDMKACLANGLPFMFGIEVYSSFESDEATKTGVIPLPQPNEEDLGGHAILCVGYEEANKRFIFRNSWSSAWGAEGYGYLPYAYMTDTNLTCDCWCIIKATSN